MQKVIIKYKQSEEAYPEFFECKITPTTKVSDLSSIIQARFFIQPSEQLLTYYTGNTDLSLKYKKINENEYIATTIPSDTIINLSRKSIERNNNLRVIVLVKVVKKWACKFILLQ